MTNTRGGLRPKSGRKPKNNGILYVRMPQDTITFIREYARLNRMSVADYIDKLLNRQ